MDEKYSKYLNIKTKEVDEECPIHHVKLVQLVNAPVKLKPFCLKCQAEENKKELQQIKQSVIDESYQGYLRRFSLVDRTATYGYTFKNFKADEGSKEFKLWQIVRHIAGEYYQDKNKKFNSLLFGSAGSGKTHLAMSMLNAVNDKAEPKQRCVFLSMTRLMSEMKMWFSDKNNRWSPAFVHKVIQNADLVVIDDLGAETANSTASNFVQDTIFDIYESNQRIITTSNLSLPELENKYHGRLISRILEGSRGHLVNFENVSDKRKQGVSK